MLKKLAKNQLISASFILLLATSVGNVCNYFYHLVIGKMLGPVDYGLLSSLISLTYLLGVPTSVLAMMVIKYVSSLKKGSVFKKETTSLFYYLAGKLNLLVLYLCLFSLLISPFVARFIHTDASILVFLVLVSGFIGIIGSLNGAVLQGLVMFKTLSIFGLLQTFFKLGASILLVSLGLKVFGAVFGLFLTSVVYTLALFIFIRKLIPKNNTGVDKPCFKSVNIFNYAVPVFLVNLSFVSFYTTDILLARHFLSSVEAGYYSSLAILGKIIFFASSIITSVMFPIISHNFENGKKYLNIFYSSFILVFLSSLAITLIYLFFPGLMIKYLFGDQFLPAKNYLFQFAVFISLYSLCFLMANFFLSVKKVKMAFFCLSAAVVQIVLIVFFHQNLSQIVLSSTTVLLLLFFSLLLYYLFSYGKKGNSSSFSHHSRL